MVDLKPFTGELDAPTPTPTQLQPFDGVLDSEKSSIFRRAVGDTAVSLLKGAVAVPQAAVGLADIVTAGRAGKAVKNLGVDFQGAQDILSNDFYSAEQKAANRKVAQADGFVDSTKALLQNPSVIAQNVVELLPSIGAGGIVAQGVKSVLPKLGFAAAGAIGEGVVGAGSAAENIRNQNADGNLTGKQAAMALGSGAGTALIGGIGGKLAQKAGIADIDTLATGGAANAGQGIGSRVIKGGISEGLFEELPQSVQEQVWSNAAQDKPLMQGVGNAAASGLLAGAAMGAGANIRQGTQASEPKADPANGSISRAASIAETQQANVGDQSAQNNLLAQARQATQNQLEQENVGTTNDTGTGALDTSATGRTTDNRDGGAGLATDAANINGNMDNNAAATGARNASDLPVRTDATGAGIDNTLSKPLVGAKIDKNWTNFSIESGSLGIPRADMPQIKAENRGALVNFLNARGITSEKDSVPATSLKPTQAEFSPGKVKKAQDFTGGDRSILVSSDGYVVDGHHQWLAKRQSNDKVNVIKLNAPINQLLSDVKQFPSATNAKGETFAQPNNQSAPFLQPSELRRQAWKDNARAKGITDEKVLEDIAPQDEADAVTGFYPAKDKAPTLKRAIDHVAKTGQTAHFIEADISNLGGLNTYFENNAEKANKVYREITDIFSEEVDKTGGTAVKIRHGGDEFNSVIVGATDEAVKQAMANTQQRVAKLMQERGLDKVPHPKYKDDSSRAGVGVYLGQSKFKSGMSMDDMFDAASKELNDSKAGGLNVGRNQSGTAQNIGTVQGRPGGLRAGDNGLRPDAAGEDRAVQRETDATTQEQRTARGGLAQDKLAINGGKVDNQQVETPQAISQNSKSESIAAPSNTIKNPAELSANPLFEKHKAAMKNWLPAMQWATEGGRIIRNADGDVTGRTQWHPVDYELDSIRSGNNVSYTYMRQAVQKALDGKKLSDKQAKIVDSLLNFAEEISQATSNTLYQQDNATAESDIDEIAFELLESEINGMLREAGIEERARLNDAKVFEDKQNDGQATKPRGTQRETAKTPDEPTTKSTGGDTAGSQRQDAEVQTAQRLQPTAITTPSNASRSREREGVRPLVEALIKRRKAANELGKEQIFDIYLAQAKRLMASEQVNAKSFKLAATQFKNDKPLFDTYTALFNLIAPEAKAEKASKTATVDAYKQRIAEAKTVEDIQTIQGEMSRDVRITDKQLETLDDLAIDAIDALDVNTQTSSAVVGNKNQTVNNKKDLLGDNTQSKQSIADSERAKNAKRNTGDDNAQDFKLSGSDSEADKAAASGARTLFSRSATIQQKYEQRIDELFDGKPANRQGAAVLDKSDVLDMLGYGNKPVHLVEHKVISGQAVHKLTAEHWKKIPEWLENPAAVFDSETVNGSLVFVAPELFNGAAIRIIVEPNVKDIKVNLLISAYEAEGKNPAGRWVRNGLLRYIDKAKSRDFLKSAGLQLPSTLLEARSSGNRIYTDSNLVKYRAENNQQFSRNSTAIGMNKTNVQATVNQLKSNWKNAPEIIVVDDINDVAIRKAVRDENERQLSQGAQGQPEGFFDDEKVYVVASEMASQEDIQRVIFHETLGHYGLQGTFGDSLNGILNQVATLRKPLIAAEAKQYGLDITNAKDRLIAAEEVLAEMAQTNPQAGFVKRAIAAIRQWLRANGFNLKLSDNDIVVNYLLPARAYVQRGAKAQTIGDMVAAFNRNDRKLSKESRDPEFFQSARSDSKNISDIALEPETWAQAKEREIRDKFNRFKVLQQNIELMTANEAGYAANDINAARDYMVANNVYNPINDASDVHQAETTMHGKVSTRVQDFRERQLKPLIEKTQKAGFAIEDIADFLKIQHAPEANKRMAEIHGDPNKTAYGISTAGANEAMRAYKNLDEYADLKAIADEWRGITELTKRILLDGGVISTEQAGAWDAAYQLYVPVKGGDEASKTGLGKGLSVNGNIKKRLGHELRDEKIIENVLRDHERAISMDEKNRVGMVLLKFLMEAQNDEIGTIAKPEKRQVLKNDKAYQVAYDGNVITAFTSKQDAQAFILENAAITKRDAKKYGIDTTTDQRIVMQASPMLGENEVNVYVAGHAIRIQLNDEIAARAYKNLGVEHLNSLLSGAREFNTWLSKAYTGYNPEFALKNLIRDALQGAVTLTGDYGVGMTGKIFSNYPKAVKELLKSRNDPRKSEIVTAYRKAGGSTGASYLSDIERIGSDVMAAYNEYAGAMNTYQRVYDEAIKEGKSATLAKTKALAKAGSAAFKQVPVIGHFLSMMERINAVTENALRVATFMTLQENGYSAPKAASAAKNLMNFNRKGEITNQAGALYLFFNPNIQGTARLIETLGSSKHKNQARAAAGMMVLGAMILAEMARSGDDEEKWKKIPNYIKDRNLVLIFGDTQVMLPVPYGYGAFHTLGNMLSDYGHGEDGNKLGIRFADNLFQNFSPVGNPVADEKFSPFQLLPTIPKMALAPTVNENSFGNAITPKRYNEFTPDSQLMNRNTKGSVYDQTAYALNELTGGDKYRKGVVDVSPETLKFWVSSLTGGAGKFAADAVNIPVMAAQGVTPDIKELPIARSFVRESGVSDARSAFWKAANEAKAAASEFSQAKKARDLMAVREIFEENKSLIALDRYANHLEKVIKTKRDAIDAIRMDDTLSLSEKRAKMKAVEQQEQAIYDLFLLRFNQP